MIPLILLVDDDRTLRTVFRLVLEEAGYAVLDAASVAQALLFLSPGAPAVDLVISDQRLPGISGVELLRVLRLRRPGLPLLGLSGAGLEPELAVDPELVGVRWLAKPITAERLVAEVKGLIGSARVPNGRSMEG